jgi:hypothetical protein
VILSRDDTPSITKKLLPGASRIRENQPGCKNTVEKVSQLTWPERNFCTRFGKVRKIRGISIFLAYSWISLLSLSFAKSYGAICNSRYGDYSLWQQNCLYIAVTSESVPNEVHPDSQDVVHGLRKREKQRSGAAK